MVCLNVLLYVCVVIQDTEVLLEQLKKDQEAVEEVQEIVEQEEGVMQRETQIVQDYADVSSSRLTHADT